MSQPSDGSDGPGEPGGRDAAVSATRWRRRVDVLQRRVADTWVLLAVDGDEPLLLEGTGAAVWELLEEPRELSTLVEAFADATDGSPDTIRDDLTTFLTDLEASGLVERD